MAYSFDFILNRTDGISVIKIMRQLTTILLLLVLSACGTAQQKSESFQPNKEWQLSEDEWKERLAPMEFEVLRNKGTERAFTGEYWNEKTDGTYVCRACQLPLFSSETKYKSGSGWPSFYQPVSKQSISEVDDYSLGMIRKEVVCARCGGHLGHVFNDGPQPTGLRYCLNSVSLTLIPKASNPTQ